MSVNDAWSPTRCDIIRVGLGGAAGDEKRGTRPAVIVQCDDLNRSLGSAVCAPVTSRSHQGRIDVHDDEVLIPPGDSGLERPSVAQCHQLRTLSLDERLVDVLGWVPENRRGELDDALKYALGL